MNFGNCPYDDCAGFLSFAVPDNTPQYIPAECPECKRKIWYRLSRIDPRAYTEADFLKDFTVDHEKKTVVEKNPVKSDFNLPKIDFDKWMAEAMGNPPVKMTHEKVDGVWMDVMTMENGEIRRSVSIFHHQLDAAPTDSVLDYSSKQLLGFLEKMAAPKGKPKK